MTRETIMRWHYFPWKRVLSLWIWLSPVTSHLTSKEWFININRANHDQSSISPVYTVCPCTSVHNYVCGTKQYLNYMYTFYKLLISVQNWKCYTYKAIFLWVGLNIHKTFMCSQLKNLFCMYYWNHLLLSLLKL